MEKLLHEYNAHLYLEEKSTKLLTLQKILWYDEQSMSMQLGLTHRYKIKLPSLRISGQNMKCLSLKLFSHMTHFAHVLYCLTLKLFSCLSQSAHVLSCLSQSTKMPSFIH